MFVMVRMRVHEHMELPEDFEVDCSPWDTVRSHELVSRSVDHRVAAGFDEGMKAGVDFER